MTLFPDGDPESAIESIGADVADAEATEVEAQSQPTEVPDAKPATPTPATPRDERGRFAEKASTSAAQVTPTGTPTETPVEPTAPEAVAEGEPVYPVSTYRADGQEFQIPGSAVGEDGHFIPTDVWQREVLPLLAAGRAARGGSLQKRMQDSAREIDSWKQQAQAAQAQSQAIIAKIDQMVEANTIGEWLDGVHQNWPILKARAEADALRMQQQAQAQLLQGFQAEQQRQALEPQFSEALEQSLLSFGQQAGLDETQLGGLYQQLNAPAMRNTLFVRAPFDDPMTGLRAGDWAINNEIVQQWVQWAGQYQPKTGTLPPKVAQAQAQNAKRGAATPPPVVGGKGGAAPSGKPKPPQYKDGKDALKRIFDDEEFNAFEVVE